MRRRLPAASLGSRAFARRVLAGLALVALAGGVVDALAVVEGSRAAPRPPDATPRTAVMSAFPPELLELEASTQHRRTFDIGGTRFTTGRLEGRAVVLCLSGVSMVNAAMTAERMIENFKVTRIVFSGIAGGADPSLNVGDVVAPERWAEYLESVMARETTPGVFAPPPEEELLGAHLGMIYPKSVGVRGPDGRLSRVFWFPADRRLLSAARRAAVGVHLQRCVSKTLCLSTAPKVRVGGSGVSGPAFVDNAALRAFLFKAFSAQVIDMESAAVAHVAYADAVPFIAFRSLSDLAGGDPGKNQAYLLFKFAAGNSAAVVKAFLRALPEPPQPAPR